MFPDVMVMYPLAKLAMKNNYLLIIGSCVAVPGITEERDYLKQLEIYIQEMSEENGDFEVQHYYPGDIYQIMGCVHEGHRFTSTHQLVDAQRENHKELMKLFDPSTLELSWSTVSN